MFGFLYAAAVALVVVLCVGRVLMVLLGGRERRIGTIDGVMYRDED